MIDLKEKGMSRGEFDNVARALGGWEKMVNPNAKDKMCIRDSLKLPQSRLTPCQLPQGGSL